MIEFNTATEIIEIISKKVEKRRKKKKLTQKELALKAGVSYGSYRGFIDNNVLSLTGFISILQVLNLNNELNNLVKASDKKTIAEMREEDEKNKRGK